MAAKPTLDVSPEVQDALLEYLKDSIASGVRMAEALGYDFAKAKLEDAAAELSFTTQSRVVPMRGHVRIGMPLSSSDTGPNRLINGLQSGHRST